MAALDALSGRNFVKDSMPASMRVLIPAAELSRRVRELAALIDADYRHVPAAAADRRGKRPRPEDDPLIAVGVLKGSGFFLADLLPRLSVPVAVDFLQTSSYGTGGASPAAAPVPTDPPPSPTRP